MSKSAIYVVNTTPQTVAVGGTIIPGGIIRRFGCALGLSGNSVVADEAGYYDIAVSVTAAPTAAGTVTVTLFNNGVAVPGATASATAAGAGDPLSVSFDSIVRVFCGANTGAMTLVLTGAAATVSNVAIAAVKL